MIHCSASTTSQKRQAPSLEPPPQTLLRLFCHPSPSTGVWASRAVPKFAPRGKSPNNPANEASETKQNLGRQEQTVNCLAAIIAFALLRFMHTTVAAVEFANRSGSLFLVVARAGALTCSWAQIELGCSWLGDFSKPERH